MNKNQKIYIDTIGLNTLVMLSTDIFPSNIDLKPYITDVFQTEYKEYLYKSRTLLIARVNRHIADLEAEVVIEKYKKIKSFTVESKHTDNNISRKRSKSKDNLRLWLDNI